MPPVRFHIQNIFDVFERGERGVDGFLKLKVVQVHNRGVTLARSGDIVAVSEDCPQEYVDYVLKITGVSDVTVLRYRIDPDPNRHLNASVVFGGLSKDPRWKPVLRKRFELMPYIQSAAFFKAAREAGIDIPDDVWNRVAVERIVDRMNDKAIFHRDCLRLGIPVPRHWIIDGSDLAFRVIELLDGGSGPLYVRRSRSAGAYGNFIVFKQGSRYVLREVETKSFDRETLEKTLESKSRPHGEFVVSVYLNLAASPGTLFHSGDRGVRVIAHTGQILDKNGSFQGFIYPIDDRLVSPRLSEIEAYTERLVEPWRRRGYRGYGNVDSMITADGRVYVAELNARQTATMPPLSLAGLLSDAGGGGLSAPRAYVYSRDKVQLRRLTAFEQVRERLDKRGLLIQPGTEDPSGVIITIPPSPLFGIKTAGFVAMAKDPLTLRRLYSRTIQALGGTEEDLLLAG